jgi:predicted dehydrogenase
MQSSKTSRREFLKTSALTGMALAGAGYWISDAPAAESSSPNEKIRFACIGIGGKGKEEARDSAKFGDVVALCDVDDDILGKGGVTHSSAKLFQDWREMFDEYGDQIDAVTVSTPDHSHAVIAAAAMRMGKHAFVQKPLTHSLYEARTLAQIAKEMKIATQMGNQGTAGSNLRREAAMIRAGVLGPAKEVHVWTNRPIWDQGIERPTASAIPKPLHWKLWLGPAPLRPYAAGYHTFKWRGWWDFGTGSLGDMACHTMNMPYMALDLRNPISVQAETTGHNRDSYPSKSKVTYEFAANDKRPAIKLYWYDGSVKPPRELLEPFMAKAQQSDEDNADSDAKKKSKRGSRNAIADSACLVVGEKGSLYSPGDYAEQKTQLHGVEEIEVEFPESPGHFAEWVRAIKGGEPAMSNFPNYAVPLTETVLLGNLAIWAANEPGTPGKKIEWDAQKLEAKNAPEVARIIKPEFHNGFSV